MPTYLGRTRLLFGLVLLGVWRPYLLTAFPRSHNHHTRMCGRVSVIVVESKLLNPIYLFAHLQRSRTILQLQLALHRIPLDQILPRIAVQNFLLLPILHGLRNLLRFLACIAPILWRFFIIS
jgi:hypothetical protein